MGSAYFKFNLFGHKYFMRQTTLKWTIIEQIIKSKALKYAYTFLSGGHLILRLAL